MNEAWREKGVCKQGGFFPCLGLKGNILTTNHEYKPPKLAGLVPTTKKYGSKLLFTSRIKRTES